MLMLLHFQALFVVAKGKKMECDTLKNWVQIRKPVQTQRIAVRY